LWTSVSGEQARNEWFVIGAFSAAAQEKGFKPCQMAWRNVGVAPDSTTVKKMLPKGTQEKYGAFLNTAELLTGSPR